MHLYLYVLPMTREHLIYRDAAPSAPIEGIDPDPDKAIPGWYRHKLRSGGIDVAVRIWFGPPLDPWTNQELDRGPRMNASLNGVWVDIIHVWPNCAGQPITEAEGKYLIKLQEWGKAAGHEAIADPRKRLSSLDTPVLF